MPTDATIARAVARKEALEREIEFHQREAESHQREAESRQQEMWEIETFLKQNARFSEESTGEQRAKADFEKAAYADSSTNGMVTQEQFENDIKRTLLDNGRPMKRGQIINALHSRGLRVGGTNEAKNFGTKMWKARDRFVNIASEGYWPRDIPCSAVKYEPEKR